MKLARAVHLDESDRNVYFAPARTGEWCTTGGFEFSDWTDADLVGKSRQAFANGWLGLETFGRATLVAVTPVESAEAEMLAELLARHFHEIYGAPSVEAALPAARDEIAFMAELCEDQPENTLLAVHRELTEAGVKESFSAIESVPAELEQVGVHGSLDS